MYKKNKHTQIGQNWTIFQILRVMKLMTYMLMIGMLQISLGATAQKINLSEKNASLSSIFKKISQQTGYGFLVEGSILNGTKSVSIQVSDVDLGEVLKILEKDQPITFSIKDQAVLVSKKTPINLENSRVLAFSELRGRVVDTLGNPLTGATISVLNSQGRKTTLQTSTDREGLFYLKDIPNEFVLEISFVGFITRRINSTDDLTNIVLRAQSSILDETVIIAYGTSSRRLLTGSVSKVSANQIEAQPISNPLLALAGYIPGLDIRQEDGLAGGSIKLEIRGKGSLTQKASPLIIVDGIPFISEFAGYTGFPGTNSTQSALSVLNPADIESIEVLKDAASTSIYGSRGANGVILITTKRGKNSPLTITATGYTGYNSSTVKTEFLNLSQYLEMRKEAFKNDGIEPTILNAPDLIAWDTTRYVDWANMFFDGLGTNSNVQLDVSGGNESTQFRIGFGYHRELPLYHNLGRQLGENFYYNKGNLSLKIHHKSKDERLSFSIATSQYLDKSKYAQGLINAGVLNLPPNAPYPLDDQGALVWSENGASFENPLGQLYNHFYGNNKGNHTNFQFQYSIWNGLYARFGGGINSLTNENQRNIANKSYNPASSFGGSSTFYNNTDFSWILEPMMGYRKSIWKGDLDVLLGYSFQSKQSDSRSLAVRGYSSDIYLGTLVGATSIQNTHDPLKYLYSGLFGKVNYTSHNKYVLDLSARRDGSSRFGPKYRFSNFGAIGLAYLFMNETWMDWAKPILSFGKLRWSYGSTGNDNIGDYKFFEQWSSVGGSVLYDGKSPLRVYGLFNPVFTWEKNVKMDVGLDIGLWNDKILIGANYYRNVSSNQLINYKLPSQAGSTMVLKNFEAVFENTGLELTVEANLIKTKELQWDISSNIAWAHNELVSFPNLSTSTYANRFVIGEPITMTKYYPYDGVNSETGLYSYPGVSVADRTVFMNVNVPDFQGGLNSTISYKGVSLSVLAQFVKKEGHSALRFINMAPGTMANQPTFVMDRWQYPGDEATIQKFTTTGAGVTAFSRLSGSSAYSADASYIRLRNMSISYTFQGGYLEKLKLKTFKVYGSGQNLGLWTRYKYLDPETMGIGNPLTKVYTLGFQIQL